MSSLNRRRFLTAAGSAAAGLSLCTAAGRTAGREKKPRIKIGQIGTGHAHARGVFSQLKQVTSDFELVGIVENDPKRRKALGDSFQGVKLISEEQLLNTKGLQAVVVETEVPDLLPTANRCIDAGMHIHLDKPAGENLADFAALLKKVAKKKRHLQMGYIYRYHTAFQWCYKAVADGMLGDVFEVHAVMSKKVGSSSRKYLSRFAGGSMFEIGCHVIDAMVRVLSALEETMGVALVDHGPVFYRSSSGDVRRVDRAEFRRLAEEGKVGPTTAVFDTTLTRVGRLRDGGWERPACETWHGQAFFRTTSPG